MFWMRRLNNNTKLKRRDEMKTKVLLSIISFLLTNLWFTPLSQAEIISVNYCDVRVGTHQVDVAAGRISSSVSRVVKSLYEFKIPVDIIVSNCGRDTINGYSMRICLSKSSPDRCEEAFILENVNENIRSGYSSEIQKEITVPYYYPPGDYWLVLDVDTNRQTDSNPSNNLIASRDKIRILPIGVDLAFVDNQTTVNYRDGDFYIDVNTWVCNRGDESSDREWILSYYFDTVPGGTTNLLYSREFIKVLEPQWSRDSCSGRISSRIPLPPMRGGTYWITLKVYQKNHPTQEFNLDNNMITKSFIVNRPPVGYPDLLISSVQPKFIIVDGKYYIRSTNCLDTSVVTLENRGVAPSLPFKYKVFLNSVATGVDYLIFQSIYNSFLNPQSSVKFELPPPIICAKIPPSTVLPTGEYRMVIEVDSDNEITEVNEANNRYTVTDFIVSVGVPDFAIDPTSITLSPSIVKSGEELEITCRVTNKGSSPIYPSEGDMSVYLVRTVPSVRIHESGRPVGGIESIEYKLPEGLWIQSGQDLMPNNSVTVSRKIRIPDNIPGGEYAVKLKVSREIYGEIETSNNVATSTQKVTVIGKTPEYTKTSESAARTQAPGEGRILRASLPDLTIFKIEEKKDCSFEITIKNLGGNLTDDLYQRNPKFLRIEEVSASVVGARGGILFEFNLNSVDPQKNLKNTNGEAKFIWTVPRHLLPIDRKLKFTVNPTKEIKESNEGNNTVERLIRCESESSKEQRKAPMKGIR